MKHLIVVLGIIIPLFFACVKSNDKSNFVKMSAIDIPPDSTQLITADEFIVFFEKFSKSLLCNNTLTLSDLIVDKIGVDIFGNSDGISKITTMNFNNDTIMLKSQFLKEFKKSLNPVYVRLLKKYNVREDIVTKNYCCSESINKYDYSVETYYDNEYNDVVAFEMLYSAEYETNGNIRSRGLIFVFSKTDGEIKLEKVIYNVSVIYVNYNEL